jgi:hypothetical protein
MLKPLYAFVASLLALPACLASELTPTEMQWLRGAWPVIAFVRSENLPLDIVVQPQASPGAAPLALAFVDGRCKLVLSMRGNAQAQATLDRIEPELLDATLELMAAHELGHCRRYLDGAWYGLPAGFTATAPEQLSPEMRTAYVNMKATRREEGYGDLVGLAWAQQQHPQQYARLHTWLLTERSRDLLPGSHHDTLAWVRLAQEGGTLAGPSIFAAAARLWATALELDE